ncbi:MAG: penicillin-binding transpeptidase domain-containing protein, partial [Terriglobia bacterium]
QAPKKTATIHHAVHHRRRVSHKRRRVAASTHRKSTHKSTVRRASVRPATHHKLASSSHSATRRSPVRRVSYTHSRTHHVVYRRALYRRFVWSPWSVSSFSNDPALGDTTDGEVASIRDAAVKALGHWNGSIVVVDPNTGRILAMVNQKLALTRGYIPCSTVKPLVALAGLDQGVISLNTKLMGMFGRRVDLTEALAHSDNQYFAEVGEMLGFSRVKEFAEELGYGQRATLDLSGESPGVFPSAPPPQSVGGVGRLTSFGTGIDQTPLQMAAIVSAIANGGTLYWLQYPRTPEAVAQFTPQIRRVLTNLTPYISEVRQGMAAAVLYGTARSAYNPEEDIFGKTGTCSEDGGRMGWFVSYSEEEHPQYVVVVMLRGGRQMFGPHAAEIAGNLYRSLLPGGVQSAEARQAIHTPTLLHRAGE